MDAVLVRLVERREYEVLQENAMAMGYSVDARKVDAPVARPFEVRIHGVTVEQAAALADGFDVEIS